MRTVIQPPELPSANSTYSQAIQAGGFVFVSGQLGVNPETGRLVSDDIAEQAKQAMENLVAILRAAGSSLDKAVKATVYLKDMNDFEAMNEVYARYLRANPPARSTVEVTRLPRDVRVEVDLITLA